MHYKILSVIFIALVTLLAFVGLKTDTDIKKVQFVNQNFNVINKNTNIENRNVEISLSESRLSNKSIHTNSKSKVKINNSDINTKNIDLDNKSSSLANKDIQNKNLPQSQIKRPRYLYKNISWNEWKSTFTNQFLDDLNQVQSLNKYGLGSWFYYSFDVMNDGTIRNIDIFSFYINGRDKQEIKNLIKKYEYQEITIFPQNSKRKKAKVDAIVVLSTEESRTNPSDFNDHERVRLEY